MHLKGSEQQKHSPPLPSGLKSFAKPDMASQNRRKKLRRINSITGEFDATYSDDFAKQYLASQSF